MCSKIMPPTVFDLYEVPTAMALNHIIYITDGFNFVSPDYADNLYESLKIRASRPNSTVVCGYIPSPPATLKKSADIIKQVIGKEGYYFKLTTSSCGIDFIYHDRKNEMFLFWGRNKTSVENALRVIRGRICKTVRQ